MPIESETPTAAMTREQQLMEFVAMFPPERLQKEQERLDDLIRDIQAKKNECADLTPTSGAIAEEILQNEIIGLRDAISYRRGLLKDYPAIPRGAAEVPAEYGVTTPPPPEMGATLPPPPGMKKTVAPPWRTKKQPPGEDASKTTPTLH